MPLVERDGVKIHFEVVGEGPPVVLLHGSAGDRTMWRHAGYVDGLDGFSRVLVDSRSRGLSGRLAAERAHRLEEHVALWRYSSGAHGAAAVAQRLPEWVGALITTSWTAEMGTPEERDRLIPVLESSGMNGLNSELEREEGISLPSWMREQFLATDPGVFVAEVKGFGDGSQVRASLGTIRAPALLLVGAMEDPEGEAARTAALLPSGKAVTLPGVGHIGAFLASEQAQPHALGLLH